MYIWLVYYDYMYNCDCSNFMCIQDIKNGSDGVHA